MALTNITSLLFFSEPFQIIHLTTPPIMYKPKKKAPKKILMKKKYSMALTNITSLLYKVHKNTHTILHYNNLCTRLLYQHQLSRAYNCSKNASEKISKADKRLEKEKKNQYRQLKPYI